MKKIILLVLVSLTGISYLYAQNTNPWPSFGSVGIGTNSPLADLHVVGSTRLGGYTSNYTQVDANGNISFVGASSLKIANNAYAFRALANANIGLYFNAAGNAFEFKSATGAVMSSTGAATGNGYYLGRLGINTTAPVNKLEVVVTDPEDGIRVTQNGGVNGNGGAALHLRNTTLGGKMWSLYSLGQGNTIEGTGNFLIQESDNYAVNAVSRFIIQKGTGNVGIGTVTPTENLVVSEPAGAVAGTQNFLLVETVVNPFVSSTQGILIRKDDGQKRGFKLFQDGSDDANSVFKIASFSAGSDIDRLTIKRDNGNVGIGTNAPTAKLSVNGTANNTTGAWGVFSDSRVKKVIADFTDGLNVIKQIHTIKFNYNENAPFKAEGEQIGVVAQELEKVAPYMVNKKAMGDMKDLREVNNQAYPFLLINAVKELAAENEELKKQVADIPALKNEIAAIKAMLTSSIAKTIAPISQQDVNFETAYLDQNIPNPPTGNFTKINYNIPNGTIKAELVITDNAGRKIKQISLNTFGKGLLNLDTKGLASGTYAYTMYVDGKIIDTKKMVVVK